MAKQYTMKLAIKVDGEEGRLAELERLVALLKRRDHYVEQKSHDLIAWRRRFAELDGQIKASRELVEQGIARVEVEVEDRYDYEAGTTTVIRLDTGEIVETRPMTHDEREREMLERQGELELPDELPDEEPEAA